jgi:hypothetical protein
MVVPTEWAPYSGTTYPYNDTFMNLLLFHRDLWARKKSLPLALATEKP